LFGRLRTLTISWLIPLESFCTEYLEIAEVNEGKAIRTQLFLVQKILCFLAMTFGAIICHSTLDAALAGPG
jgi:hypothetical protein